MSKVLTFLFLAAVLPLLPAFFFFIGIKTGYIDYYGIEEYFNIIFVDKISWGLYWTFGLIFASLFMLPFKRLIGVLFALITVISMSMLIDGMAHKVGTEIFAKDPFYIKKKSFTYKGVLLYEGRDHYYLLNDENNRTMKFNKEIIDEAY
jgi:hypothetical protein